MLRHFSIPSRKIPNGFLTKLSSWILGVPMERIYILRGRGPTLCFNMISWISSQNRQFMLFVLIVCFKGVMPHKEVYVNLFPFMELFLSER